MSWDFKRHDVAKKVLVKHLDHLHREQASVDGRRGESMRDLQRELLNLQYTSTPDLTRSANSPRLGRRGSGLDRDLSKSLTLPTPGAERTTNTPPYARKPDAYQMTSSRMTRRRQSEPVAASGKEMTDVQKLMRKALNLSEEPPEESWNKVLESTLPKAGARNPSKNGTGQKNSANGAKNPEGMSRLQSRRGTVALTEGISLLGSKNSDSVNKDTPVSNNTRIYTRRGSLPVNAVDVKHLSDATNAAAAKSKKLTEEGLKNKRAKFKLRSSKPRTSYREMDGVSVTFYNEDTGEEGVPLPLPVLSDSKMAYDADSSSSAEESEDEKKKREKVWEEVAKCRHLRGYDPPEMKFPAEDAGTFVFGRNYNDVFEANLKAKNSAANPPE